MNLDLKNLIISMCSLMSISGHESTSEKALTELIGKDFDRYETDAVGNHYFYKDCLTENAPTVLIDAHFDEIGLISTQCLDGGFIRIANILKLRVCRND